MDLALGGLDPERGVAALAGAAGDQIAPLGRLGQGEEGLGAGVGRRDQGGIEPVVGHHGETIALERLAQRPRESVEIPRVKAK
jgi:hypothetical protein